MSTLAELLGLNKSPAPAYVAPQAPTAEMPQPLASVNPHRELGAITNGEQIPMDHPQDEDSKNWERARHSLGTDLAVTIEADGTGWLCIVSPGRNPIYLLGPLKTITAPF